MKQKEIIIINEDGDHHENTVEAQNREQEPDATKKNIDGMPLMKTGYSLEVDMKFGWKPTI